MSVALTDLPPAPPPMRDDPSKPLWGPVTAGGDLGRMEEEPVHLCLRSARPNKNAVAEELIRLTVMPFHRWDLVKKSFKAKHPILKDVPDTSIRLLHKGTELRNGKTVDYYNLDGGTAMAPMDLQYLIIDPNIHEPENGMYIDSQMPPSTAKLERLMEGVVAAWKVGIRPKLSEEGTGATYMLKDPGKTKILAVFKPKDEEAYAPQNPRGFNHKENSTGLRAGVLSTQQAAREVAAFLVDHHHFARVPETTLVHAKHPNFVKVNGKVVWKIGSFQEFVDTSDTAGNFASQVFGTPEVHRIAILDIRIVNLDRNDGNLLVKNDKGSRRYELVPIDHGLSLPDRLEVTTEDLTWMGWPQAKQPFQTKEMEYIRSLDGAKDAKMLSKGLGIRRDCLRLLEVTTRLLQVGAEKGLTLFEIGNFLYRDAEKPNEKSRMEVLIQSAVDSALTALGDKRGTDGASELVNGLDLRTARQEGQLRLGRQVTPQQRSNPDWPHSPAHPAWASPSEVPPFQLSDTAHTHSESDTAQSQDHPGTLSSVGVSRQPAQATDKSTLSPPPRVRVSSYRHGSAAGLRSRPSAMRAGRPREQATSHGGIFWRRDLDGSDWTPEIEKAFMLHLDFNLKDQLGRIKKEKDKLEKEREKADRERDARQDEEETAALKARRPPGLRPADISLASALWVVPPDSAARASPDASPEASPREEAPYPGAEERHTSSATRRARFAPRLRKGANKEGERTLYDVLEEDEVESDGDSPEFRSADSSTSFSKTAGAAEEPLSLPPPTRGRYVPPQQRRAAAEAAAAALISASDGSTTAGSPFPSPPTSTDHSWNEASNPPTETASATTQAPLVPSRGKYVPPAVRRAMAEAAAAAAAAAAGGAAPETAASEAPLSEALSEARASLAPLQSGEGEPAGAAAGAAADGDGAQPVFPAEGSGGTARYGFCLNQGPRAYMEDAVHALEEIGSIASTEFYAVYDGHGGTKAVDYVKKNLPLAISSHSGFEDTEQVKKVLIDAFMSTDRDLLDHLQRHKPAVAPDAPAPTPGSMALSSGCVACITLLRANRVYVANLGDCRALLCGKDGEITSLTEDHRPEDNLAERSRLKELGIEVSTDGYLHGRIGVSRAFGDWAWDAQVKCPGLIAEPEVLEAEITEDTEFLLIACDGIFDKMTTKEAGQIVRRRLRATGNAKTAAEDLVKNAAKRDCTDNMSAVVVLFKRPSLDVERSAPRFQFGKGFTLSEEPPQPSAPAEEAPET